MKLIRIIPLLFIALYTSDLSAQEHPILSYFKAAVFNGQVVLTWNIEGGNTCNGITIFHSNDSINYDIIGEIPGICGAVSDSEPYRFTDVDPAKNQLNYYKLQLGNQGFTSPLEILFYETTESGFYFYPNPSSELLYVYVDPSYQNSIIEIYDALGKKVISRAVNPGTMSTFSAELFEAGSYIIRLLDGTIVIGSEKLIRID